MSAADKAPINNRYTNQLQWPLGTPAANSPELEKIQKRAASAFANRDSAAVTNICDELLRKGDLQYCWKLALQSLEELPFSPELSEIVGSCALQLGKLDQAYFHLFNAYVENHSLPAGYALLRVLTAAAQQSRDTTQEVSKLISSMQHMHPAQGALSTIKAQHSTATAQRGARKYFMVSNHKSAWPASLDGIFIADPFVSYQLDRAGLTSQLRNVERAPFIRQCQDDKAQTVVTILAKQKKYLEVLCPRLNQIHGSNLSYEFWKRSLSICFERYVGLAYEMFQICETYFDPARHFCSPLSEFCHYVPLDFDEQRFLLEHWSFGREQLFSSYIAEFYPDMFPPTADIFRSPYKVRELSSVTPFKPVVGIMSAFFAPNINDGLRAASGGRIDSIGFQRQLNIDNNLFLREKREILCATRDDFDRFDRFFFRTLRNLMPKVFVEYFPDMMASMASQFEHLTDLKYVISEMWIGEAYEPIALALLKETRGVQLIYNEHNINAHQYKASLMPRWADYCDIYIAHGDYGREISNVLQLGSLYNFGYNLQNAQKVHGISYVSGLALARDSDFCCYDTSTGCGENCARTYTFKRSFFAALSQTSKDQIYYRGYRFDEYLQYWEAYYSDDYLMGNLLDGIKRDDFSKSCREVMASSNLVVIEYLMTSYLESLFMNIPTVILFSGQMDAFNDQYSDYLDDLIRVGICQTDPVAAAKFIENVKDNPQEWWNTAEVQEVRRRFVERNIGDASSFFNYLVAMSGS